MNKNKVISVFPHASAKKLYIEFYDNLGKKRQKSTKLKDTSKNRKYIYQVLIPAFEKELVNRSKSKKVKHPLSYYAQRYIEHLIVNNHCKLNAHSGRVKRILNYFGESTLPEDISELDIENFIHTLVVSRDTKLDWLVAMRGIFDRAVKDRAISENVARNYKVPKSAKSNTSKHERMPFSPSEMKKILDNAPKRLVNFFAIGFYLGLRPEEILALTIEDIDFDAMSVHVNNVITHGIYKPVSNQKGGPRKVPLFKNAIKYLRNQIDRANKANSEFLFFDSNGNHLLDSIDVRGEKGHEFYWNTFLEDLEIFPIRKMKNTRHTFAVQSIKSNKFAIQEIASMMGHSTLRMLLQHYGNYLDDANATVDRNIDIFDC